MANIFEQVKALGKLPGAFMGMQDAKSRLYMVNKELKAAQNRKNPLYGKTKHPAMFDKKKVARAANKAFNA